jgi:hypothetical protein
MMRKVPLTRTSRITPKRRTGVKPVNAKRKAREFKRCYHSKQRVEFVRDLPCIITGLGPCENVHIEGDGAGRKAGYDKIVPMVSAIHAELHRMGVGSFCIQYDVSLEAHARLTQAAWLAR